jgi:hypothetical protein
MEPSADCHAGEGRDVTGPIPPAPADRRGRLALPQSAWVFRSAFLVAAFASLFFICIRGWGWDGDSVISATQFVRLLNPSIYGIDDGGTHPKLLCIVLFGVTYQLAGSFVPLTLLSVLLNASAVALVCKWIQETQGNWLLALAGFAINIPWHSMVASCDNPAFSVPFLFAGLYFYCHGPRIALGAVLLLISSLFRPGAELVLLVLLAVNVLKREYTTRRLLVQIGCLAAAVAHSVYGFYLAYPSADQFRRLCVTYFPGAAEQVPVYKHSLAVVVPYVQNVVSLIQYNYCYSIFLLPAAAGVYRVLREKTSFRLFLLVPVSTFVLLAGAFAEGTIINMQPQKVMEYGWLMIAMASFFRWDGQTRVVASRVNERMRTAVATMLVVLTAAIVIGLRIQYPFCYLYEVNPDGSGGLKWRELKDTGRLLRSRAAGEKYRALISRLDRPFFTLDAGLRARSLDCFDGIALSTQSVQNYDVILTPNTASNLTALINSSGAFEGFPADVSRCLFVRKGFGRSPERSEKQ